MLGDLLGIERRRSPRLHCRRLIYRIHRPAYLGHGQWQGAFVAAFRRKVEKIVMWCQPDRPARVYEPTAALISLMASSLAHSAGPAMVPISQPCPSINKVVGIPKARPIALRS